MARAWRPGALTPSPGTARAVPWLHLTRRLPSLAAPELAPPSHEPEEPIPTVSVELAEPPLTTLKVTRVAKPDRGLDTPAVA